MHNDTDAYEQFLKLSVGLGLGFHQKKNFGDNGNRSETCPVAQLKMPEHLRELGALKPTRNMSLTIAVMADHAIVSAKTL